MALFRKTPDTDTIAAPRPGAIVASAARFTFGGKQTWQGTIPAGDRRWQIEAWRHYDINGEMRYATGWKANACKQALLVAVDVDPDTGQPIGPTENKQIRDIAGGILGGPARRGQHIRTMVINLEVAGEVFVVVVARKGRETADTWLVVSGTELWMQSDSIEYMHPDTGKRVQLGERDTLIRIWYPHPRLQLAADSPIRALLPTLREIEKSSQNIAARLDSRLAGAGIMTVPSEADVPTDGDADAEETASFSEAIQRNMSASLADPGSAASQVPLIFEVPAEFADAFRHITLETPLSKEVVALRQDGVARFAAGSDLPREIVEGMGESNHWSAAQVSLETYRTHLVPTLDTISDAFTVAYLHPIAEAAGIKDVERYSLDFDGSMLVGESDPLPEALELYDRGLITGEAVLKIAKIPLDYMPSGDEKMRALAERLVTAAPALFEHPVLSRILGFTVEPVPVAPAEQVPAITAAANTPALPIDVASLAVVYALERAGNRLLNTQRLKGEFADVPTTEVHVRLKPDDRHGDLLAGAWRHTAEVAEAWNLDGYTRWLLAEGAAHTTDLLAAWMATHGRR